MTKETLFTFQSLYRDDLRVTGYRFGSGEPAPASWARCGATRCSRCT